MDKVRWPRWVVVVGVALIALSAGMYAATPDLPEIRQVELTVLAEKPDGSCQVRWRDPYTDRDREDAYQCDPDRDDILKDSLHDPESGEGWDSGWVLAEGAHKGELYSFDQDKDVGGALGDASDILLLLGLPVTLVGLIAGGLRAVELRTGGVSRATVRRAHQLRESAARVHEDHRRAVEAVVAAWAPVHTAEVRATLDGLTVRGLPHARALRQQDLSTVNAVRDAAVRYPGRLPGLGRRATEEVLAALEHTTAEACDRAAVRLDAERPGQDTTALLRALRVLVAAGPETYWAVERARALGVHLTPELIAAAARPRRSGRWASEREQAEGHVAARTLHRVLAQAGQEHLARHLAQASVELLRGADPDPEGLAARADFAQRPAAYYWALEAATRVSERSCAHRTAPEEPRVEAATG
ncbi:hypothetical protein [Streptomyces paludis]|uniref:Bifunctional protein n=1 Tax=Streptomyces paludis TaxID=2282738 RepID=A0A345HIN7_9ACTN|nr:hypothetical protein [Streptomyces paludis]AXG76561.1 hypothetical protein DVK44_01500 [Streptomyces paludis]